jgi:isoleucyl-tRNA synthetase
MYQDELLKKYEDIIKEEINIKEIKSLDNSLKVKKIFKPIGGQLSAKFGKDTGKIIQFGKMGNIKQKDNNQIIVFDDQWNEWTLENSDYEIAYEGLDGDNIAIDNEIIAKLDLTITPELAKEGVAREISRFINQMRKDAKYNVDDKVHLLYNTESTYLGDILTQFWEFLQYEALIKEISSTTKEPSGDIIAQFNSDENRIIFSLTK